MQGTLLSAGRGTGYESAPRLQNVGGASNILEVRTRAGGRASSGVPRGWSGAVRAPPPHPRAPESAIWPARAPAEYGNAPRPRALGSPPPSPEVVVARSAAFPLRSR